MFQLYPEYFAPNPFRNTVRKNTDVKLLQRFGDAEEEDKTFFHLPFRVLLPGLKIKLT